MTERRALATQKLTLGQAPALLVVDASRAFTDPNSPLGGDFAVELAHINTLEALANQRGWPSYYSNVCYDNDQQAKVFRTKLPALNALKPDSQWIAIDDALNVRAQDTVFSKTHASCFFGTPLDELLRAAGIDSLVICGFTTSGCVRATVVDALQYDYPTMVVREAVGDRDSTAHDANLYDMHAKYAQVVGVADLQASI